MAAAQSLMTPDAAADLAAASQGDEFAGVLARFTLEFMFGSVWTRGALDPADRSLATLAMLVANRDQHLLPAYTRMAIRNGVTSDELGELLLQAMPYAGFPVTVSASQTIADAIGHEIGSGGAFEGHGDSRTRGREALARTVGAEIADSLASRAGAEGFAGAFAALAVDFAYGDVWARPGLSFARRSIVTIAILIALRAHGELKMHLPIGLANGLSVEQIDELLLHALPYAGFPAVVSAGEIWREFRD